MTSPTLEDSREAMRRNILPDEAEVVQRLKGLAGLPGDARAKISKKAADYVRAVRGSSDPGLMESFLAEYGLSTKEGVALMCLAEALLRVPDAATMDELIEDKIAPSDWGKHLGHSSSSLVNASTWGLMLTGKVLDDEEESGLAGALRNAVRRLGEPVIRVAVGQAMKEMGRNFVLGRDIKEAMDRAKGMEAKGYTYSYDMLGEAARTDADARGYHMSYTGAIAAIAKNCNKGDIRKNPGISVKLSALHARYEFGQRDRVMNELVARARSLAMLAKSAGMGFNIDAEEQDRLDLSLDVIREVLSDPALAGWDGFGVVVQAYGPRASYVLDYLHRLAEELDRKIMVRLVKGAYWDTEIKRAQVMGLEGFPVFTRKVNTDISYAACAKKLMDMRGRIYPQFATHNAHTVATVLHMAGNDRDGFEFQRLHGMGEALYTHVMKQEGVRCRIYAPVGAHRDLLAYLVRRLLENGANSSFVNQIVDEDITPEEIARDPFSVAEEHEVAANPMIDRPKGLFDGRRNSKGWDLTDPVEVAEIEAARAEFRDAQWTSGPMLANGAEPAGEAAPITNPAFPDEVVGHVTETTPEEVDAAIAAAREAAGDWGARPASERADCLRRAADLYEEHAPEFFAIAAREAGKTLLDGVAEVREAVDFLRYYANEAERLDGEGSPRGVFACISPWNFPLAIFTGQLSAALAAGNAVIAKPAEQTPLISARATALLHEAGVPKGALQLLPGDGPTVGGPLTSDPRIDGVCFTGSTETAQRINRAMADKLDPAAPLIAETGGLNAMIVDSSALPEQAVRDVIASSFQSAGQRCSALRVLYVQNDVRERLLEMLTGAMDELRLGDPWKISTDVGPVIDAEAKEGIEDHCSKMAAKGNQLHRLKAPEGGHFVPPTLLKVKGIGDVEREIFGPVLHVAGFEADEIDQVVDAINATGYGLTFGLHTRIDDRVQHIVERIDAGNAYVNRNQIGAIVGSQPFGGEGMSGTGPKAGGPQYVARFMKSDGSPVDEPSDTGKTVDAKTASSALTKLPRPDRQLGEAESLPGPTGESNRLSIHARGRVLCLGPTADAALEQAETALSRGNSVLAIAPGITGAAQGRLNAGDRVKMIDGTLEPQVLEALDIDAVAYSGGGDRARAMRQALAHRSGKLIPMIVEADPDRYVMERHLCIDTTAAGGNASLLAATGEAA